MKIEFESGHPILFLYDIENRHMSVPDHVNSQLVDANDSCVSVGTLYSFDGRTTVLLASNIPQADGELVFEGRIHTPSKRLSVNSSEREGWSTIDVHGEYAQVRIWANDPSEPSLITIEAK